MSEQRELTLDSVKNIIESRKMINVPNVDNRIEVSGVSLQNRDGEPHIWPDSQERYAVVYLKAMTPYHLQQAITLAKAGDLQGATNQTCSLRVPFEVGQGMLGANGKVKPMLTATVGFDFYTNKEGEEVLSARKCFPNAYASDNQKVDFQKAFEGIGIEA